MIKTIRAIPQVLAGASTKQPALGMHDPNLTAAATVMTRSPSALSRYGSAGPGEDTCLLVASDRDGTRGLLR